MSTKLFTSLKEARKHPLEVREFSLDCYREKDIQPLFEFPHLESLIIIYYDLKQIDQIISRLPDLKKLVLSWGEKNFPEVVCTLKSLSHLEISHSPIKFIPGDIHKLKILKHLNISYLQLKKLPNQLFDLKNLTELILENNKLENIPEAIYNLKKLKYISLHNNLIKELPTNFATLPLEDISLGFNPILDHSGLTDKPLKELFRLFSKREQAHQTRALYFQLLLKNFKKAEKITGKTGVLSGLNGFFAEIRLNTARYFYEYFDNPFECSPQELSRLRFCIIGKIKNYPKAKIREIFNQQNITLHTDIRLSTTHIIIGEFPRKKLTQAIDSGKKLVAAGHLTDYLHKLQGFYLMENNFETQQIASKILRLLESKEEANQKLALELAQGGGLNPEFMYEIILMYIWNKNIELKKLAETVLEKHLPADTFLEIKTHQKIFDIYPSEETLAEYLSNICGKKLDPNALGIRMYRQFQRGRLFCLRFPQSFLEICKDETRNNVLFINNLNLKELHNTIADLKGLKFLYANHNHLSKLPSSFKYLKTLHYLYLHNNAFKDFPEILIKMRNLKKLYLSSNRISQIPHTIDQLQSLEQLHLRSNKIQSIPGRIFKLKKLRLLNLEKNPIAHFPSEIEKLRTEMPNCQIKV